MFRDFVKFSHLNVISGDFVRAFSFENYVLRYVIICFHATVFMDLPNTCYIFHTSPPSVDYDHSGIFHFSQLAKLQTFYQEVTPHNPNKPHFPSPKRDSALICWYDTSVASTGDVYH